MRGEDFRGTGGDTGADCGDKLSESGQVNALYAPYVSVNCVYSVFQKKGGITMSWVLRAILILASVLTCFWILRKIRKSQVRIEDSVFWLLFSLGLIVLSLFPQLADWAAGLIGMI